MSTLGKMDEESTERDKKQTKIISGSAHLENKWLHIASYPSFFWAVCAALRRLQAIDVGGCWIAKWISNWTFCVQGRLHAVLPHTKTLAVFPSTNPRDRTRLWARVARVQAASGVKAQEDGLLPRWWPTPFPAWPCCYRFNPPVAAVPPSPPPLLRLPPSDSEVLVDDCSINRHPFLIAPPPKKQIIVASIGILWSLPSTLSDTTPARTSLSLGFRPSHPFLLRISDTTDGRPPDDQTPGAPILTTYRALSTTTPCLCCMLGRQSPL